MTHWDVAIVGAGAAGMSAAIAAAGRGAKVLLIDAADMVGGALHLSSGSYSAAGNAMQKALGIEDSPELHYEDAIRLAHGTGDRFKQRLWTQNAPVTLDWLFEHGLEMGPNQPELNLSHEPYSVARIYTPPRGGLSFLTVLEGLLGPLVDSGRVTLMLSTRVRALDFGQDGKVSGLTADGPEGAVTVSAASVVLACGGYAHSPRHWQEFHGLPGYNNAWRFARGDGVELALGAGGQVGYLGDHLPTVGGTEDIDNPGAYWIHTRNSPAYRQPWEIFVNLEGRRFLQEDRPGRDWRERLMIHQPEQAFWAIWDEAIQRQAPSFFLWPEEKVERAFRDHKDFRRAETLEALASACNLPAGTLRETVERYNAGQAVGHDEMGRTHLPAPIGEGPFYAVKHYGMSVITFGGVLTNDDFEVVNDEGAPIGNLYAVGEVLGHGPLGNVFLGGSMVGSAITFGKILGERILSWP